MLYFRPYLDLRDQYIMTLVSSSERMQQTHYERISADYDAHYNDKYSREYMLTFVFEQMFNGLDLQGSVLLEAMCGGGQTTNYVRERGANVTGLDISPQQAAHFLRRHPDSSVLCGSILDTSFADNTFDVISVVGGVHHMPPNVNECIAEIHRILKPGGSFCFMEPHTESFADRFRQFWYRYDPLFAKNEAAINMSELRNKFEDKFEFAKEVYAGNFGYLFVLNSMVFRVPHKLKDIYSPAIIALERFLNKVLHKRFSCFVVGQWKKK